MGEYHLLVDEIIFGDQDAPARPFRHFLRLSHH